MMKTHSAGLPKIFSYIDLFNQFSAGNVKLI